MEIRGHEGITHFGNSEGRGVKIWKPSVVWYRYFLESPNVCLKLINAVIYIIIIPTIMTASLVDNKISFLSFKGDVV